MPSVKIIRVCETGHRYYKSSDCPTCPVCEAEKNKDGFFAVLSAPARRALVNSGIKTLKQLSSFTKEEILTLHGMGPASISVLHSALKKEKLNFKK